MIEIYNEKIRDLLNPKQTNLQIRENEEQGVYVDDLSEFVATSDTFVYNIMNTGNNNRSTGSTEMNKDSSRSHSCFMIKILQKNLEDYSIKEGKICLVDLAGSERIAKTNAQGETLREAKNINKSLTTLGLVINSLTDGKSTYIPYRDSKLTRIL